MDEIKQYWEQNCPVCQGVVASDMLFPCSLCRTGEMCPDCLARHKESDTHKQATEKKPHNGIKWKRTITIDES